MEKEQTNKENGCRMPVGPVQVKPRLAETGCRFALKGVHPQFL
ncbi:hypothetical protein FHS20_003928 [Phyllobacterium endophyticum]|nr:hypothetical protein [Phyllobacterium endophyticum]